MISFRSFSNGLQRYALFLSLQIFRDFFSTFFLSTFEIDMRKAPYILYSIKTAALLALSIILSSSSPVRFGWLTDTHVSDSESKAAADLRLCIRDLNEETKPDFVLVTGDLTDFGSDEQLACVKGILDSLTMPYYVVPGNHDAKWSESGCNTFVKTFGYEQFDFTAGGFRFLGCASGPNMRMAPALIPRSDMVWLHNIKDAEKTIFVNHYPMDSSVLNYFAIRAELKRLDTRIVLGGHWHKNTVLSYDGIPGILGRSSLSSAKTPAGYNIGIIEDGCLKVCERRVFPSSDTTLQPWYSRKMDKPELTDPRNDADGLPADYPWMRYSDSDTAPVSGKWYVSENWSITEDSDIASGFASDGKKSLFYATCEGELKRISTAGKRSWKKKLPGRIFSTPVYTNGLVVVGCADGGIYAFKAKNGKLAWKVDSDKSVLASPAVYGGRIFCGASDGKFRAIDARTGKVLWIYDGVEGFVEGKAWVDATQVVFGAWDRSLYSLETETGKLMWKWTVNKGSKMYSPAACWPVKSYGRVFVAVPDRKVYSIDAATGKEDYHLEGGREAIGLSPDGRTVYSKTMHNEAYAFNAAAASANGAEIWRQKTGLRYDISPTELVECGGSLIIPTDKGNLFGLNPETGEVQWKYKLSIALVNPVTAVENKDGSVVIYASTMDGRIAALTARERQISR